MDGWKNWWMNEWTIWKEKGRKGGKQRREGEKEEIWRKEGRKKESKMNVWWIVKWMSDEWINLWLSGVRTGEWKLHLHPELLWQTYDLPFTLVRIVSSILHLNAIETNPYVPTGLFSLQNFLLRHELKAKSISPRLLKFHSKFRLLDFAFVLFTIVFRLLLTLLRSDPWLCLGHYMWC